MKISVIIPAYNEEKVIANSLTALLAEDFDDFEVILVDNGSKDKTLEISKSFNIKVFTELRKGTMWACQKALQEAKGEIIVRMDADCIAQKGWLLRGYKAFEDRKVVAVTGPYDYYDANNFFRYNSLFIQKYIYRLTNFIFGTFGLGAILIGGNSFMRKDILDKMGGFDTSIEFYGDDTDTARRLSRYGKVVFYKDLIIKTSARRFKSEGSLIITMKYLFYFIKFSIFNKI